MEITEQEFQELLKSGEYPIALDRAGKLDAIRRYQTFGGNNPNRPSTIEVWTLVDGTRLIQFNEQG